MVESSITSCLCHKCLLQIFSLLLQQHSWLFVTLLKRNSVFRMWGTDVGLFPYSLFYLSLFLIQHFLKGPSILIVCSFTSAILYLDLFWFCLSHCFKFVLLSSSIYLIAKNKCFFSDLILLEISAAFLFVLGFYVFSSRKYCSPIWRFSSSPSLSQPVPSRAACSILSFSSPVFEVWLCCLWMFFEWVLSRIT